MYAGARVDRFSVFHGTTLSTVKSFIGSSLDIMDMSESKYASFRIVRQDDGHYRASLLLNSDTNLSGRRHKSKALYNATLREKKIFSPRKVP